MTDIYRFPFSRSPSVQRSNDLLVDRLPLETFQGQNHNVLDDVAVIVVPVVECVCRVGSSAVLLLCSVGAVVVAVECVIRFASSAFWPRKACRRNGVPCAV